MALYFLVAPGEIMVKAKSTKLPIDRTGQKFRCYRVVKTIPKKAGSRFHLLKCSKCGAEILTKWSETTRVFSPMPCGCGDNRTPSIKVGDIRNNKEVLEVKKRGPGDYEVWVKCLHCGRKSTVRNFQMLRGNPKKPHMWCEHCKGVSIRASYKGQVVQQRWKIVDEDMTSMTCRCMKCGDEITIGRGRIAWLKKKPCHNCLNMQRKLTRKKIICALFSRGYPYDSIAEYYGQSEEAIRGIVKETRVKYQSPEPPSRKLTRNKIIKALHSKGYSYDSIAEYYGLSKCAIRDVVKKIEASY